MLDRMKDLLTKERNSIIILHMEAYGGEPPRFWITAQVREATLIHTDGASPEEALTSLDSKLPEPKKD